MAKNLKTKKEANAAEESAAESAAKKVVLVGTYKGGGCEPRWVGLDR